MYTRTPSRLLEYNTFRDSRSRSCERTLYPAKRGREPRSFSCHLGLFAHRLRDTSLLRDVRSTSRFLADTTRGFSRQPSSVRSVIRDIANPRGYLDSLLGESAISSSNENRQTLHLLLRTVISPLPETRGFNEALAPRVTPRVSRVRPQTFLFLPLSRDIAPPANHCIIVTIDSDLHWTLMLSRDSRRHHWPGCIVEDLTYLRERSECVHGYYRLLKRLSHDCGNNFWHYFAITPAQSKKIHDLRFVNYRPVFLIKYHTSSQWLWELNI